jgi:hypothetical protein
MGLGAMVAAGTLVGLSGEILPSEPLSGYTDLYLTGPEASGRTVQAPRSGVLTVAFAVVNHTRQPKLYRMVALVDGHASGPAMLLKTTAGGSGAGAVRGLIPADGCLHRLEVAIRGRNGADRLRPLTIPVRGTGLKPRRGCLVR